MKKIVLTIIPLTVISLLASCNKPKKCTVTFDSDGGTLVASQTVYHNEKIYEPTKPTKASTTEYTFQFEEWQLDGAKFDFATRITKDITLKAKWKENKHTYTVTFDSDGGDKIIEPQFIEYSETARVTDPGAISHSSSSLYNYTFDGWHEIIDGEMQEERFNFNETIVDHDILLKVRWAKEIITYKANATDTDNLKFSTITSNSLTNVDITAGQPFTFKMEAINSSEYGVPSSLQISINGKPSLMDGYTVDIDETDSSKATVTIDANKVTGNIEIAGEAIKTGEFAYEAPYLFGLNPITSSTHAKSSNLEIQFELKGASKFPKKENIYIQFDNCAGSEKVQWVSPSEDESYVQDYCDYDENSGKLTIKNNHINNSIKIIARAYDYELLSYLKWNDENEIDINDISSSGLAPYIFYVGEEKWIKVNDDNYIVRIIGFNHDVDYANNPVGITFEFVQLISYFTDRYYPKNIVWENKSGSNSTNYNFPHSSLNCFLNAGSGCVFYNIEEDLRGVIKTVNKKVGLEESYSTNFPYTTKLFPLSYEEVGGAQSSKCAQGEGEVYSYYKGLSEFDLRYRRQKEAKSDTKKYPYWLRSPNVLSSNCAWSVDENGVLHSNESEHYVYDYEIAVAPAFCI